MNRIAELQKLANKLFDAYVLNGDGFSSFEQWLVHKGLFPEEVKIITTIVKGDTK